MSTCVVERGRLLTWLNTQPDGVRFELLTNCCVVASYLKETLQTDSVQVGGYQLWVGGELIGWHPQWLVSFIQEVDHTGVTEISACNAARILETINE